MGVVTELLRPPPPAPDDLPPRICFKPGESPSARSSGAQNARWNQCSQRALYHMGAPIAQAYLSFNAATPGSSLPSRNSSDAPPPVETCVIFLATPAFLTAGAVAAADHGGGIDLCQQLCDREGALGFGISNTPMGPFQMTSLAFRGFCRTARSPGRPMSRMRQPSGTSSTATTRLSASASNLSAHHRIHGQTSRSPAFAMICAAVSMERRPRPAVGHVVALRSQERVRHPAADQQLIALGEQVLDHQDLVTDLRRRGWPHTAARGRAARPRYSSSCSIKKPDTAGR